MSYYTPRNCLGPGDFYPTETKEEQEYEERWEKFCFDYIPSLGDPKLEEVLENGDEDKDEEIMRLWDEYQTREDEIRDMWLS